MYIVETALLLLVALALGGAIGFWARRWFAPPDVADQPPAATPAAPQPETDAEPLSADDTAADIPQAEPVDTAPPPPATEEPAEKGKPALLSAARDGGADDLKKIKGVGPKIEKTLHDLGVYHYDQIASWDAEAVAWVDDRLSFHGRIEREDWVAQAKDLTAAKSGA